MTLLIPDFFGPQPKIEYLLQRKAAGALIRYTAIAPVPSIEGRCYMAKSAASQQADLRNAVQDGLMATSVCFLLMCA